LLEFASLMRVVEDPVKAALCEALLAVGVSFILLGEPVEILVGEGVVLIARPEVIELLPSRKRR
jgi:hypothetical protein